MIADAESFGNISSGAGTHLYTIRSGEMTAKFTDYGAALVSLTVPARDGTPTDVVLGYDSAAEYESGSCFFGAAIGRVANRIADARFELNGKTYQMDANENGNCLHGGFKGYDKRIWEAEEKKDDAVTFRLLSPDGDQGMPGNLELRVTYSVSSQDGFRLGIRYEACCDRDTLLNPTNHSYFNLNGHGSGLITDHLLEIEAQKFTAVQDGACIPRENRAVDGTPFDFRTKKRIGRDIETPDCRQLAFGQGYDHNFMTDGYQKGVVRPVALVSGEASGISMQVSTDLPALQFYAGNQITPQTGKGGVRYEKRSGFCLETQYVPDSIHHAEFESCILAAGETLESVTEYLFRN